MTTSPQQLSLLATPPSGTCLGMLLLLPLMHDVRLGHAFALFYRPQIGRVGGVYPEPRSIALPSGLPVCLPTQPEDVDITIPF